MSRGWISERPWGGWRTSGGKGAGARWQAPPPGVRRHPAQILSWQPVCTQAPAGGWERGAGVGRRGFAAGTLDRRPARTANAAAARCAAAGPPAGGRRSRRAAVVSSQRAPLPLPSLRRVRRLGGCRQMLLPCCPQESGVGGLGGRGERAHGSPVAGWSAPGAGASALHRSLPLRVVAWMGPPGGPPLDPLTHLVAPVCIVFGGERHGRSGRSLVAPFLSRSLSLRQVLAS